MQKKTIVIGFIVLILTIISLFFIVQYSIKNKDDNLKKIFYEEQEENKNEEKEILKQFEELLEINSEIIGWIKVPNTNIDYPVVKTDNNQFYLDHDFRKEPEIRGAIFMDYRNQGDGSDRHTIVYGHQSRYDIMFTQLNKFRERDFFIANEIMYLTTLYEEQEWQIFAAYETSTNFHYIVTDFSSDASFLSTVEQFQKRSKFNRDIQITKDDQILTLSTCVHGVEGMRFVVQAKRIK